MLTAELTLKTETGEKIVEVREGSPLFAGRSVECDLYLPSQAVSRRHAVFLTLRGQTGVKDLDSANGTYLNGKRITRPMRLRSGDTIQIANFLIHFKKVAGDSFKSARLAAIIESTPPDTPAEEVPEDVALSAAAQADSESTEAVDGLAGEDDVDIMAESDSAHDFSALLGPGMDAEFEFETPMDAEPPIPEAAAEEEAPPPEIDEAAVRRTRESVRRLPKAPHAPKLAQLEDIDTGDGSDDDAFVEGEEAQEGPDPQLALAKAAAEAGLVGEFNPEPDAPDTAPAPVSASAVPVTSDAAAVPEAREVAPNSLPVNDDFRAAIESRLFLYSFLADMKDERDQLRASKPGMLDAVKSELSRQDREMEKLPPPDKAEDMIVKRTAKRKDLKEKVKAAKAKGTAMPPLPSKEMRHAEDIAINQWTLIAQSAREALPAAYEEGYRMMESELLTGELERAGIDAKMLLGGAAYLLALGELMEEATYNRSVTKARLSIVQPPSDKKGGGGKKLLGFFGKGAAADDEEEDTGAVPGESYEELVEMEAVLGKRMAWIKQESAATELALIKEFWIVYTKVCLHYMVKGLEIPMAVRAFLRYGVIGFSHWWVDDEVRQHVVDSCTKDVLERMDVGLKITNVVYADEYVAAVMNLDCTPAMDENLEMNGRNTPEWKADKALRKLIHARSQMVRMRELTDSLAERVEALEKNGANLDTRIKNLLPGSRNFKALKSELSMERQAVRVEISKLSKLSEKIKTTTLADLQEAIDETEERFSSGELPRPTPEFLVEREVEAVRKIGRLLANLKERLLPMVMRDSFYPDTDACNDRASIIGEICDIERRDPAIFLETIIPSKKRANRVDLRLSPVIALLPSAGLLAFSWNPRQKPEDGRLGIPTCFIRPRLRERQMTYLMSDFRWDTSKSSAGMDVMNSETIVAAFMSVRWDWRKRSREGREKGLIYTDQNDRTNWRRVYEAYMQTAYDGGKKLYNRNYDFYERIIGKYFDMPENVELLRK